LIRRRLIPVSLNARPAAAGPDTFLHLSDESG
jgi:hypothetical protein